MEEVKNTNTEVTPEMIATWKQKYGENNIKLIELYKADAEDPLICYARVPDRLITSQYWTWIDKNMKKAGEVIIKNCLLTNKEVVLADDEYFNTAALNLSGLIQVGRVVIKNC